MKKLLASCALIPFICLQAETYVSCQPKGQLGNQITLAAHTLILAWENDATAVFHEWKKEKKWNVPSNLENMFFRLNTKPPESVKFHPVPMKFAKSIEFKPNMMISHFDYCPHRFDMYIEKFREIFAPSPSITAHLNKNYKELLEAPNTVGLQIRLSTCDRHPFLGWDYYERAMELFPKDSLFVVSSDRISWVKEHFPYEEGRNVIFIEKENYLTDFFLLSKCKNNIISGSTFGYWAAYLNDNPDKKVVCPSLWRPHEDIKSKLGFPTAFDYYPENWTVLEILHKIHVPADIYEYNTTSVDK